MQNNQSVHESPDRQNEGYCQDCKGRSIEPRAFPYSSRPYMTEYHRIIDNQYAHSVRHRYVADFAERPFRVRIAEKLRRLLIDSAPLMADEMGVAVAEAAKRGYWLEEPVKGCWRVRCAAVEFRIWYIDHSHEHCGCKPVAEVRTIEEAVAWIASAPVHEFEGPMGSAHELLQYKLERQQCVETGAEWIWSSASADVVELFRPKAV
jgi:hypothetical protein